MALENIMFNKYDDGSYNIVDLYLDHIGLFGDKDSYNYYDNDAEKIIFSKKSYNKYIIRYCDGNKSKIVPLQSKIKNFFLGELYIFTNKDRMIPIHSNDKELFKKCREIWNKITRSLGINNTPDFVKTTNDGDEFIMVDVHKNTSFVEGKYKNKLVIVLHSVFNDYLQTSLVQHKYINVHIH